MTKVLVGDPTNADPQNLYVVENLIVSDSLGEVVVALQSRLDNFADVDEARIINAHLSEVKQDKIKVDAERYSYLAGLSQIAPPTEADFQEAKAIADTLDRMNAAQNTASQFLALATTLLKTYAKTRKAGSPGMSLQPVKPKAGGGILRPLSVPKYPIVPVARGSFRVLQALHAAAPPTAKLAYNGGLLLQNAKIVPLYLGSMWSKDPGLAGVAATLNKFFHNFAIGPTIAALKEYSVGPFKLGNATAQTPGVVIADDPPASISDAELKISLPNWIRDYQLDGGPSSLFVLLLPPNVISTADFGQSCKDYCGYHLDINATTFYAVVPYSCTSCTADLGVVDALTLTASHEICESITDPVFTKGWWSGNDNEIGDICAWQVKTEGEHVVQKEWSNTSNSCL